MSFRPSVNNSCKPEVDCTGVDVGWPGIAADELAVVFFVDAFDAFIEKSLSWIKRKNYTRTKGNSIRRPLQLGCGDGTVALAMKLKIRCNEADVQATEHYKSTCIA